MDSAPKLIDKRKNWEARVEMKIFEISKDELTSYDKLVYAILCGHANRAGNAWPRVSILAAEASCSERQVQRALSNLEKHGLLVRVPQMTKDKGQIANIFEIYGIDEYTPGDCKTPGGMTDSRGAGDHQSGPIDDFEQPHDLTAPNTPPTPQAGGEKGEELFELSGKPETSAQRERRKHEAIVALYNDILPELPRAPSLTKSIDRQLRARTRDDPARKELDWWRKYFESVRQYPCPMGLVIDWRASLEWLLGVANMSKIMTGFYPKDSGRGGRTAEGAEKQKNFTKDGGEIDVQAILWGEADRPGPE